MLASHKVRTWMLHVRFDQFQIVQKPRQIAVHNRRILRQWLQGHFDIIAQAEISSSWDIELVNLKVMIYIYIDLICKFGFRRKDAPFLSANVFKLWPTCIFFQFANDSGFYTWKGLIFGSFWIFKPKPKILHYCDNILNFRLKDQSHCKFLDNQ